MKPSMIHLGCAPTSVSTRKAMRSCKLLRSTANATMRPPMKRKLMCYTMETKMELVDARAHPPSDS